MWITTHCDRRFTLPFLLGFVLIQQSVAILGVLKNCNSDRCVQSDPGCGGCSCIRSIFPSCASCDQLDCINERTKLGSGCGECEEGRFSFSLSDLHLQLKDFYEELRSNLGIRMSLSRHFLTYNFVACALVFLLQLSSAQSLPGKVEAVVAALYCGAFALMLYLTALHNVQLRTEHMSRRECVPLLFP
jgi:hypothetical protein